MKTKLVYVLTCAPEDHYIEMALMSIWSARHWNPDAHIVLITDNLTNGLFAGKRAEILDYISEKIVVPFADDSLSMAYRSRWLKTSVRQLVGGDLLFIDCDTIVCKSLEDVDKFECKVGAVPDSLLQVADYDSDIFDFASKRCKAYGYELSEEVYYFNGGVIYAKDTESVHELYSKWKRLWVEGYQNHGLADQPPLGLANKFTGRIIERIPDSFNNIVYTQDINIKDAHILHISSYRNPSYLFTDKVLSFVQRNGINNEWLIESILNPEKTILPYDYFIKYSSFKEIIQMVKTRKDFISGYGRNIDRCFSCLSIESRIRNIVVFFFQCGLINTGLTLWVIWRSFILRNRVIKNNIHKRV